MLHFFFNQSQLLQFPDFSLGQNLQVISRKHQPGSPVPLGALAQDCQKLLCSGLVPGLLVLTFKQTEQEAGPGVCLWTDYWPQNLCLHHATYCGKVMSTLKNHSQCGANSSSNSAPQTNHLLTWSVIWTRIWTFQLSSTTRFNKILTAKVILPKISSGITSSNTLYTYL